VVEGLIGTIPEPDAAVAADHRIAGNDVAFVGSQLATTQGRQRASAKPAVVAAM